jgi:pilus assembly protein CpaC
MKAIALAFGFVAAGLAFEAPTRAHAASQIVSGAETELSLETGKGRLVRLSRPASTVFIADPKIADVQVKSPTLVYLFGKAPGATSFYAVDAKEQVIANVAVSVGFDEGRLRSMLRRQTPDAEVEVDGANGALVLTGRVSSAAEGDDVLRIASLFVQGEDKDKAGKIINRLVVDAPNQINLRVRIAEVSREASQQLGFNWESLTGIGGNGIIGWATGADIIQKITETAVGGGGAPPAGIGSGNTIVRPADGAGALFLGTKQGDINVVLDALERKNLVTILAEPNLTAVSGEPASFLAGGEYPIPVPQGLNQVTIQYKQFGVSLAFVATILDKGRISLNVRPEVSQLSQNGAITINGTTVPALTTRRVETTVDLGSGQSFAIAGLLQNNVSQDLSKFPGLGDIPVVGQLLRSKRFQRNESELVIIVTPYLVKPVKQRLAAPTDRPAPAAAPPQALVVPAAPEKKG